jgi:uncharacterized protein
MPDTDEIPGPAVGKSADGRFIDEVAHPASRAGTGILGARQTVIVVIVALLTGALLDSHAFVRAGDGMDPGVSRHATLTVAHPIDRVATDLGLDQPRRAFDAALRRNDSGGGVIVGPDVPPPIPSTSTIEPSAGPPSAAAQPSLAGHPSTTPPPPVPGDGSVQLRAPTRQQPLRVLVVGDSLATYVAVQMDQLSHDSGLLRITAKSADGTGLSNPSFYNWQKAAVSGLRAYHPEVVVMVIGGNDGWNMTTPSGQHVKVGTDAWVDEYARRVAAIMQTYLKGGVQAVYWSGPPTARNPKMNRLYRNVNVAAERAALAVPRARYVDLYLGTAVNGRYADRVPFDGHTVRPARQPDGIHWTLTGSLLPASLELSALGDDLGRSLS